MSLSALVKSIQDIMRQDAGVDGDAQRISQLVWMLFLKIFDDKELERELEDDNYESPIPENLRWRNWAKHDEGITGDELLDYINNDLFKTIKEMELAETDDPRKFMVREVFQDSYNYMKSGTLLRQVINKINQVDFNDMKDRHVFNDIYEKLLKDLQSAGNAGEYYTPRAVTQFMADMVNPQLGETVLDPACGTGGFLACALENIRKQAKGPDDWQALAQSLKGIEKKPLPHLLCTTNLILHDIDLPMVTRGNSLSRPLRDYGEADRVNVIITNPPFGGTEEPGIENNFPATYRTRETADLFLLLIIQLLKDKGRAGIVLPDGFLFGEGVKTRIKERLLEKCNLHTIVRLPNGVFNPYTGIRTNLLFFEKGKPTEEIWYYEHPYPEGFKSYSKTKPMRIEEFEPEKAWWDNREESKSAWKVGIDEIIKRKCNLDIKNPNTEDEDHGDPEELLKKFSDIEEHVGSVRGRLMKEMNRFPWKSELTTILNNNFEKLINTPDSIPKLRELILQLAVQGRLVPQDPNDEPATELLKKIKSEKQKLIAEGKIKKDHAKGRAGKPLPPIQPDEIPYELPKGWVWCRLSNLGKVNPRNNINDELEVSFIPMALISEQYGKHPESEKRLWLDIKKGFTHFRNNDIVVSKITPCFQNGKSAIMKHLLNGYGAGTTELHVFRGNPESVLPEYVYIFFKSPRFLEEGFNNMTGTAGQQRVPKNYVFDSPFPFPPIEEQKRIVAKVNELMGLCDELEKGLTQSRESLGKVLGSVVNRIGY